MPCASRMSALPIITAEFPLVLAFKGVLLNAAPSGIVCLLKQRPFTLGCGTENGDGEGAQRNHREEDFTGTDSVTVFLLASPGLISYPLQKLGHCKPRKGREERFRSVLFFFTFLSQQLPPFLIVPTIHYSLNLGAGVQPAGLRLPLTDVGNR